MRTFIVILFIIAIFIFILGLAFSSYGQGNPLGPLTIHRDMQRYYERERMHRHYWDADGYITDRDIPFDCYDCYRRGFWQGYDLRQWEDDYE